MKIYILILLCSFSGFLQAGSGTSFDNAVKECDDKGGELLTMSTYLLYLYAQEYFSERNSLDSTWLPLEKNTTTGNYQWFDGRVLTELKWLSGHPVDHPGTDCGVVDVSSKQWYSSSCSASIYYLCVGSDGSYSVGSVSVDFYTAVLNCQSEGRRLPVAITIPDTDWLNNVIINETMSNDIWLGLIESGTEYGDYYKWVTGEDLTPPIPWKGKGRYTRVHYHRNEHVLHSTDTEYDQKYVCQSKSTTDPAVVRSPDKFVFVSNNAVVLSSIRKATTINSSRRFQCAAECLKDAGCVQFTVRGYLCRTFGESLVITDYNGGHVLWHRKIIA